MALVRDTVLSLLHALYIHPIMVFTHYYKHYYTQYYTYYYTHYYTHHYGIGRCTVSCVWYVSIQCMVCVYTVYGMCLYNTPYTVCKVHAYAILRMHM
jgi:hypothetical protein